MAELTMKSIKGYEILEQLGEGGFGAVYRAKQHTIGREVAIKFITPSRANQAEFIRRFDAEAQVIARLEHPHIIPLFDYWRDPDGAYLVMRYLKGGSVRDALTQAAFSLESASRLLDQIALALEFSHRHEIIHRDIKPGNILLDEDGNAYLADFGIAKDLSLSESHTHPEAIIGSLDYISPEQARSEAITSRTDIYSLGVTLYEMIVGEHPFKGLSPIERLYKHINDSLPLIENLADNVRDAVNVSIQKATAKDPRNRYSDVLSFAQAFRGAVGIGSTTHELSIIEQLTLREHEVLQMIADGLSNRQIAENLFITLGTVKWYIRQIYQKLGVRSRVQAIVRARELDLIGTDTSNLRVGYSTSSSLSLDLPEPENPYKGLLAFQTADARDFFGREDVVEKLLQKMQDENHYQRFLAVVGPSGSGKSSLVRAGLIPAIWNGKIPDSERWFVVDMIPSNRPLDKLETALIRISASHTYDLHEQLSRDSYGLLRVADIILPNDDTELLLVIDQFEEIFTLVEDEAQRQHFLDLIYAAVTEPSSRIRIVVTLRADYYDKPLHYPKVAELLRTRMETVLPLSAKAIERAVRGPAERVKVRFEAGLVEQIVSEITYQAGALPLLQYALTELFEQREGRLLTNAAYQQIGGVVGALAHRVDDVYKHFSRDLQALTEQIFLRLVTLGEGAEDTRRRTPRSELHALSSDVEKIDEIIDTFVDYRLLALDTDAETHQPLVEVAHEAVLREWERLRLWLNNSRDDIRQERLVAQAATEWEKNRFDDSYLLHGTRLDQIEMWRATTKLLLTPLEKDFITQSITDREYRRKAELERKVREAEIADRAAQYERRAKQFRQAAFMLGVMVVLAVITTMTSIRSTRNAQSAQSTVEAQSTRFSLEIGRASTLAAGGAIIPLSVQNDGTPVDFVATLTQVSSLNQWQPRVQTFNGVDMVFVPAGCFMMGSVFQPNEQPVHEICFDAGYWIDRYETTVGQYTACAAAGVCTELVGTNAVGNEMQPANRVSWFQAQDYCQWRESRLPTEAEWEYAARGPDSLKYPWGNEFVADNVVFADNSASKVADIGSRPEGVSWVGAYDMSGNVWEWTSSMFREYPYHSDDGREALDDTETVRVLRGGAFVDSDAYLRGAYRYSLAPSHQSLNFFSSGMRCVRDDV